MWWIRELRYSPIGKMLLGVVALGIVAGLGYMAYQNYDANRSWEDTSVEAGGGDVNEASVDGEAPLTPRQMRCEAAKGRLQRIVDQTLKFSSVNAAQSNSAFESYARAVRACTYNEFQLFEKEVLVPWASGSDMFNAAKAGGDLDKEPEEAE